jgi:hypothetical protein
MTPLHGVGDPMLVLTMSNGSLMPLLKIENCGDAKKCSASTIKITCVKE